MKYMVLALGLMLLPGVMVADVVLYDCTQDTEVYEDIPDMNFGAEEVVEVYADWEDLPVLNSKAMFMFPVEATGESVTEALLRLYVVGNHHDHGPIAVFRAAEAWGEMTVTWNNRPSANYDHQVSTNAPVVIIDPVMWEIDVTDIVQAWVDGESNHGFYLEVPDNNNWVGVDLATKENPNEAIHPELYVDYFFNDVSEEAVEPVSLSIPHHSRGSVTINYSLPASASATLTVYDVSGAQVERISVASGERSTVWNAESGVYFVCLTCGTEVSTGKFVLLD